MTLRKRLRNIKSGVQSAKDIFENGPNETYSFVNDSNEDSSPVKDSISETSAKNAGESLINGLDERTPFVITKDDR